MSVSPLTQQDVDQQKGNPYHEDESGFWFRPNPPPLAERFPQQPKTLTEADIKAEQDLAKVLHERYVKKPGHYYDLSKASNHLRQCFAKYNYTVNDELTENKLDLITAIHTFQFFTATEARDFLTWCVQRLSPTGYVFLRMPDHDVAGFERDLKPEIIEKVPSFWNIYSFLELLSQVKLLRIVETYTIQPGQRDYFLKLFPQAPRICAGMIAKNEERDLPKCLDSLKGVVDGLVLLDTGSTDKTIEIAKQHSPCTPETTLVETYLGASEQNEKGDWQLWDFGKARNQYVEKIEQGFNGQKFDYVLWMDADDILLNKAIKNLPYLHAVDAHGVQMLSGGQKWIHHRLWKTGKGIRYTGACHEYPHYGNRPAVAHTHVTIFHDAAPGVGEGSNQRNKRILEREVEKNPTPRNCFYLANTHKDGGRYLEAIPFYEKRMAFGKGYEDEYWFAALYRARCQRLANQYDAARKSLLQAVAERGDWAEFWLELAFTETSAGNPKKALGYALIAQDMPLVPTALFREHNRYTDQPYRVASWAAEHAKDYAFALSQAYAAREKIGSPDKDWEDRIVRLEKLAGK